MNTTPASLLERLRQPSDSDAWPRFVKLYTPLIYGWARRAGLQEQDANDLVQEVFLVLVQKLPQFHYDSSKSFRKWLQKVTLNKWREKHRRETPTTGSSEPLEEVAVPDPAEDFWETEYREELAGRALQLIQAEFEVTTWKAFWEFVAMGRSAADVAREFGISTNAVYIAKFRVLCRLRQELDGLTQ